MAEQTIGIDLGGTNCKVAWFSGSTEPQIIANRDNERMTPTVLAKHSDGQLLVGRSAMGLIGAGTDVGVRDFLTRFAAGDAIVLNGQAYSPETLTAHLLRHLKADAETRLNEPVRRAVVAVPVTWNQPIRSRLCQAGQEAQLTIRPIESAAAAVAAGFRQPSMEGRHILVYDLGGTNFTVTVLALRDGLTILKTAMLPGAGGTSFDRQIVDYVSVLVQQGRGVDPLTNTRFMTELYKQAEQVKIMLGAYRAADVVIVGTLRAPNGALVDVEVEIEREEFERMIEESVQSTIALTRHVIAQADLSPAQIDAVILVGGSTSIPRVWKSVQSAFGVEKMIKVDPIEGVALGAAWIGGASSPEIQPMNYDSAIVTMPVSPELRVPASAEPSPPTEEEQIPVLKIEAEPAAPPAAQQSAPPQEKLVPSQPESEPAEEGPLSEDEIPTVPPVPSPDEAEPSPEPVAAVSEPDVPPAVEPAAQDEISAEAPVVESPDEVVTPLPEGAGVPVASSEPQPFIGEKELMPQPPPPEEEGHIEEVSSAPVLDDTEPAVVASWPSEESLPAELGLEAAPAPIEQAPAVEVTPSEPEAPPVRLDSEEVQYMRRRRAFPTPAFVRIETEVFQLAAPATAEDSCLDHARVYLGSLVPENLRFSLVIKKEPEQEIQAVMTVPLPPNLPAGTPVEVSLGVHYDTGAPFITVKWQETDKSEPTSITCREWVLRTEEPEPSLVEEELLVVEPTAPVEESSEPVQEAILSPLPEERPTEPAERKSLYGAYEPLELLESARHYQLYLSRHPDTGVPVRLKVFAAGDEHARSAFLNCLLPVDLIHPNVVRVYDFGRADAGLCLVAEHVAGGSLRDWLATRDESQPVPLQHLLTLIIQVCEGLQAIHQRNIFHRNIKPSNVLIDAEGHMAKIADFDIAVSLRSQEYTTHVAGTLPYMAKEVLEGRADRRADIYAVGVMLYELATGRLPFWASSQRQLVDQIKNQQPTEPRTLNPQITEHLNDVIMRAIEKDVSQRFQSAEELRDALVQEPESLFKTITIHDGRRSTGGE
jgi:actin-like ATPase involved in cell morphogenesis